MLIACISPNTAAMVRLHEPRWLFSEKTLPVRQMDHKAVIHGSVTGSDTSPHTETILKFYLQMDGQMTEAWIKEVFCVYMHEKQSEFCLCVFLCI